MSDGFERIDDVEIVELAEILKRVRTKEVNDAGGIFIAQLMGMRRLITSQYASHEQLMKAQEQGHREMLSEQRRLVRWQQYLTIATWALVAATVALTLKAS